MKALIIEDDVSVQNVFRSWFENKGFNVETADSREAANAIIQAAVPSHEIITVDINLRDIQGDETISWIEEIRKSSPDALLLVISGVLKSQDGPRLARLGADASFEKMDVSVEKTLWKKILDAISGLSGQANINRNLAHLKKVSERLTGLYNENGASLRVPTPEPELDPNPKTPDK